MKRVTTTKKLSCDCGICRKCRQRALTRRYRDRKNADPLLTAIVEQLGRPVVMYDFIPLERSMCECGDCRQCKDRVRQRRFRQRKNA